MDGPSSPPDAGMPSAKDVGVATDVVSPAAEPAQAPEKRMTAQDAEQAKVEKDAANIQLMDDMVGSVSEQGEYFVELGGKESGGRDSRVLILKHADKRLNNSQWLAVTREGILTITTFSNDAGSDKLNGIVNDIMSGKVTDQSAGLYEDGNAIRFALDGDRGLDANIGTVGLGRFNGTTEQFQECVKKSIDMAESPHKKVVEDSRAQTELAQSTSAMLKALPPRE